MKWIIFFVSLGNWFLSGYVFMTVWAWFVVSTFGINEISYTQALGLSLVLVFFKNKIQHSEEDDARDLSFAVSLVAINILTLGIGFIVHAFI